MGHGIQPLLMPSHSHNKVHNIPSQYTLHICILESVSSANYLCVDISSVDLSWDAHINRISKKANNTLGFLRNTKFLFVFS